MRKVAALVILICVLLVGCGGNTESDKTKTSKKPTNKDADDSIVEIEDFDDEEYDEDEYDYGDDFSFGSALTGEVTVKKNTSAEKPISVFKDTVSGGYSKQAATLRESIRNTTGNYDVKGTTYYISPNGDDFEDGTSPKTAWQSLDALLMNNYMIKSGDAVLFERGGVYRENSSINAKSGVIYGAYGKGEKPCIYGSAVNYASGKLWESSNKKNIWKMEFPQKDAGVIVFNYGESSGVLKSGLAPMAKNGDFYHNTTDKMFYLYCDKGNPGLVYDDIEIGTNQPLFVLTGGVNDVLIDNICFRYTGSHGISGYQKNYNITITNCELGWIGGSHQNAVTRFGNAIQFWDSCWDINISNNWVYQVYDAGITYQYSGTGGDGGRYNNIVFSKNLVEYCTYSFEVFTNKDTGTMKNITFDSNVLRCAGYGFGSQRPNALDVSHICGWGLYYGNSLKNVSVINNIFDCSTTQAINWASGENQHKGFTIKNNTFYQIANGNNPVMNFGLAGRTYAKNQAEFEKAIATFDENPKLVKWLG